MYRSKAVKVGFFVEIPNGTCGWARRPRTRMEVGTLSQARARLNPRCGNVC